MTGAIVAAVNAHIALQASVVISPANSAWTAFLTLTANSGARAFSYCCRCAGHGNMKIIPMTLETVAHRWGLARSIEAVKGHDLCDHEMRLVICGDGIGGTDIEACYLGGVAAADRIQSWL